MKIKNRLLSIILASVVLLTAIPISSMVQANNTAEDVLINNFDDLTDITSAMFNADLGTNINAETDSNIKYSESGNSIKITTIPSASATYKRGRINLSGVNSSAIGFKLWMKNPTQNKLSIAVQFIDNTGTWINMKSMTAYYTTNALGVVTQHLYNKKINGANEGCIYLEPGFEGFVYLPLSCGNKVVAADKVTKIALSAYTEPNAPITYYIDELRTYSVISSENWVLRSFGEYTTTAEMKTHMTVGGTQSVELDKEQKACVIDTGTSGKTSGVCFRVGKENIYNDHTGMRIRLKTSGNAETKVLFKWEATQHRALKANANYYLVDSAGNINAKKASNDNSAALVTLPANFDGWLYVPFASAYSVTNSDIWRVYLNAVIEDKPGRNIAVYQISLYKELPVENGPSFIINNFEDYDTTQNLKDALVNGNTTPLTIDLEEDAWGSKGLSITQATKDVTGSVAVSFGASTTTSQFTGFKVRIKANQNANILIKSEDTAHRPMKPKALYYLESSDGKIYSYSASSDSASLVQFAAGFDGWIYIPFSSIDKLNAAKAFRLWFAPEKLNDAGTKFVIDDVALYFGTQKSLNDTPISFKRTLPNDPTDILLDFDKHTSTTEMSKDIVLNSGTGVTVELDTTVAQNKNSCKFTFKADGGKANNIVAIKKNAYYSEITGFRFWVKTSDADESVSLLYKVETNQHRPLKSKATYYLVDSEKNTFLRKASADNTAAIIALPAGFEGWIYVPFDSIYPMNLEDLHRIWFNFTSSTNASKTVWIDSISCYKDNPVVQETDIINDFDIYSGTADLLLDSTFQAQSEDGSYAISKINVDGNSGKSFKIKSVKSGYKFTGLSDFDASKYHGFTFYVNNPSNKEVNLQPQTDSKGRDSFIGGRSYFTENKKNGEVKMEKFGKIIADAGNITIPAGFEGYVYLPFSSAYPSLQKNIDKLNALWFSIRDTMVTGGELYMDTLAFYNNNTCRISDILVWKQDTANMMYGFEKSESIVGYRGWISGPNTLKLDINKNHKHSGKNSLKISTPVTSTEDAKNTWAVTALSLANEDGTYNPVNMYDGIAFWIKVERDGTNTTPTGNKIHLGFKVDMPSHGRLNTNSPIYIMKDGENLTNPTVYNSSYDGCTAVELSNGFSGMIYIPFSELKGFTAKDIIDVNNKLSKIYIMFRLHSLMGYNVYIDDVQGYNTADLINVQWPGDPNYDPLNDSMLFITDQKYVAQNPNNNNTNVGMSNNENRKNNLALPIILGSVAVVVGFISFLAFVLVKKKKVKKV